MFLSLIASATVFAALVVAAYSYTRRTHAITEDRVRALAYSGRAQHAATRSYGERVALPLDAAAHGLLSLVPSAMVRRTEQRLATAGRPMTAAAFYALVLMLATVPAFAVFLLAIALSGHLSAGIVVLIVILVPLGAWAPFAWLRTQVGARQTAIRKELTDVLDLLTLCVESGLGLDAAFRRVSEEMVGPLSMEIEQMLHEVDLGKPRREALVDMAGRTVIPEVSVVVNAMIQSQQMGTSLAQTLRSQTQLLRMRRRQRAEQLARQASVKMAFPLVLFLMPSVFIVVLGPIAINLYRTITD